MTTRVFESGDHLRVHRGLYWHHGIYVGDDRVIEFGGRARQGKSAAVITEVSVADFASAGTIRVVQHPQRLWSGLGMGLPEALPAEKVVHRALWLVDNSPTGRYHLVGSNCEHVANWCVTGWYFESLQIRAQFGASGVIGVGAVFAWKWLPPWLRWTALAFSCATALATGLYNTVPFAKWRDVLDRYPGYPPAEAAKGNGQEL
ncbi:MAG: lecithin retinol acyltransferase family protein [Acidimicrobiales bacterium]